MSAAALFSDGSSRTVTSEAAWSSSNSQVASVAASGVVTFMAGGTARITALYQGQSGVFDVSVIMIDPSDALSVLSITPTAGSVVTRGATIDFTARLLYTLAEPSGRIGGVAEVANNPFNVFAEITPAINLNLPPGTAVVDLTGRFTIPQSAGQNVRLFFQLFPAGATRTNVLAIVTFPIQ